jgi:putative CocE/NonD family hydrolase
MLLAPSLQDGDAIMSLASHLLQRVLRLDPPLTRRLTVQHDLPVPMPDGAVLLADRWFPRSGGDGLPTALVRSPYGRRGMQALGMARPLAERGFQVLIQSTRGTFGSGGVFDPLRQERQDGLATLDWIIAQPWFGDALVLIGGSYSGYVQWAVADQLPPQVKAMVPMVTESALTMEFLRADGLSLETPFQWGVMTALQEQRGATLRAVAGGGRRRRRALATLPLGRSDLVAAGRRVDYIHDILTHDRTAQRWAGIDHRHRVADVTVPVSSIAGWYDIFLPGQLQDFTILQDLGRPARLTVGPWTHVGAGLGSALQEAVDFGLTHAHDQAHDQQPPDRAPVRVYVTGQETWRDFDHWPPRGYPPRRYHLHPHPDARGALSTDVPHDSKPDRYRYDPADPTPAVGGVRMARGSGRVDNTALEARADVVTYTTPPLDTDVEIIGEVHAEIWFRSSLPYADVFVRLCDVDRRGRSYNVCDGLVSLARADQLQRADVPLWPTAHLFGPGHRIRVQISSGAFPRYARNPGTGTGEPHTTATTLRAADQEIHHAPDHASAIILPVRQAGLA